MAGSTKKVGAAGRYGARYGGLARKKVATIERVQRANHVCVSCGAHAVNRRDTAIWACRKCGHTFAGGAYAPSTGAGRGARKALRGITDKLIRAEAQPDLVAVAREAQEELDELDVGDAVIDDSEE